MKMNQEIEWIEPIGGPLVIIDSEIILQWNGILGEDFEFACSFSNFTSVATYKSSSIIILGDEPLLTGVLQKNERLILIIDHEYKYFRLHRRDLWYS